jgi:hypothetical protein
MNYYEEYTGPKIDSNKSLRINWNKYLGQSLDSYIKTSIKNNFPEGKVYAIIAKTHGRELDINERSDWHEVLKSNIGSTYSRIKSRNITNIDDLRSKNITIRICEEFFTQRDLKTENLNEHKERLFYIMNDALENIYKENGGDYLKYLGVKKNGI